MSDSDSLAETIASVNEQDPDKPTHLRTADVKERMKTKSGMARAIRNAFGSVESLLEAVESDTDLTTYDGIGPKTADVIQDWYENRFEREGMARSSTVTKDSPKSATITFHNSWKNAIGIGCDSE